MTVLSHNYKRYQRVSVALTVWKDRSHLQVAGGQSYNGRLIQLTGNGRRKRKQFCQFVELGVLLLASRLGRVLGLVLHRRRRRRCRRALPPATLSLCMRTPYTLPYTLAPQPLDGTNASAGIVGTVYLSSFNRQRCGA